MQPSPQSAIIIINEMEVFLTRKRIKNLILRISREGQVKISAPLRCSQPTIDAFLQQKWDWIVKYKEKIAAIPDPQKTPIATGESHWVLGHPYSLVVVESMKGKQVILEDATLYCFVKATANEEEKQAVLSNWHRQQLKALIPPLIEKWEAVIGVHAMQWGIKAMKTRWGSCNTTQKRIWLSLHLIHKPIACLEYVIVHELVHLLEASHNKRFYALMSQFMPEWKAIRQQLR